jgi:hypothetical protein
MLERGLLLKADSVVDLMETAGLADASAVVVSAGFVHPNV